MSASPAAEIVPFLFNLSKGEPVLYQCKLNAFCCWYVSTGSSRVYSEAWLETAFSEPKLSHQQSLEDK